jgi:hypothetical protein
VDYDVDDRYESLTSGGSNVLAKGNNPIRQKVEERAMEFIATIQAATGDFTVVLEADTLQQAEHQAHQYIQEHSQGQRWTLVAVAAAEED